MNVVFLKQFHMRAKKKKSTFILVSLFCLGFLLAAGPVQVPEI